MRPTALRGRFYLMTDLTGSLNDLRKRIRQQRRHLSTGSRLHSARRMNRLLWHLPEVRHCRHIAVYLSVNGEMDTRQVITTLWQRQLRCYLPRLGNGHRPAMSFAPYHKHSRLTKNRFDINEPMTERRELRDGRHLDLVLVPLVAFDKRGNRLGMGGGFYDRTFSWRRHRRNRRPLLIGLAYEFQHQGWLPSRPWDVPLDMVVTDRKVRRFHN